MEATALAPCEMPSELAYVAPTTAAAVQVAAPKPTAPAVTPSRSPDLATFKPTKNMVRFADKMLEISASGEPPPTLTQLCKSIGVTRYAYYKWLERSPCFPTWCKGRITEESSIAVHLNVAQAASGQREGVDLPAAKLFLALFENWSERTVIEQVVTLTVEAGDSLTAALASARQLRSDAIDVAAEITDA